MPVFFICSTAIQGENISLSDPLYTHLCRSLRVRIGQKLIFRDEQRKQYHIIVSEISKTHLTGKILDTLNGPSLEKPTLTLAQSILKPDHMAWSIQKATELGIYRLIPIITQRVQSRVGNSMMNRQRERWQKIALEAAQQSERWEIPEILHPQSFTEFLGDLSIIQLNLLLTERGESLNDSSISFDQLTNTKHNVLLAVGPEGGWNQEEIQKAEQSGFKKITLGEKILRSETASIAGLVMLQERLNHLTFTTIS
ncbi:MAG: RsmE family RNA methyltransferase [Nitrospirales bacterium]